MLKCKSKLFKTIFRNRISRKYSCYISYNAEIAEDVFFPHPTGIVIGDGVKVGSGCIIYQNVTIGRKGYSDPSYPVIENDCKIYSGAVVIGGITLREGTTVGANSVVLSSSNSNDMLVGIPAKCHGKR